MPAVLVVEGELGTQATHLRTHRTIVLGIVPFRLAEGLDADYVLLEFLRSSGQRLFRKVLKQLDEGGTVAEVIAGYDPPNLLPAVTRRWTVINHWPELYS